MKRFNVVLLGLVLMASAAQAEIRSINITVFGMD
jgi:hypothetical protein